LKAIIKKIQSSQIILYKKFKNIFSNILYLNLSYFKLFYLSNILSEERMQID